MPFALGVIDEPKSDLVFILHYEETGENLDLFSSDLYLEKATHRLKKILEQPTVVSEYIFIPVLLGYLAEKARLSILDFGGGPGITYLSLGHIMESTDGLTYHVFDNPDICELGRTHCSGKPGLVFFEQIEDLDQCYDFVFFASVLQYVDNLSSLLEFISSKNAKYILVSDAMVGSNCSFVTVADYYGYKHPHAFHSLFDMKSEFARVGYDFFANMPFIPVISGQNKFYDMSNLPDECQTERVSHLLFEKS